MLCTTCLVEVEHYEYLMDLLSRLLLVRFVSHHLVKLIEFYLSATV